MGNAAFHFARELSVRGHEVTVITMRRGDEGGLAAAPFRVVRLTPLPRYGNAGFLPQLLWRLRGQEIIHLHYPFFGGDYFAAWRRRWGRGAASLVISYQMDVGAGGGLIGRYVGWHNRRVLPWVVRSADRVIVTSYDYARAGNLRPLIEAEPDRFREIPLGVDLASFLPAPPDPDLRRQYGIGPDDRTVLFVASLDRAHFFKGLPELLKAVAPLEPRVKLVVVGEGDLRPQYEKLAADLGIGERVKFAGAVSDRDLVRHYNLCDLFAMPSVQQTEAFGLVFVEAGACAKPVIGTRLPGVRTVIDDGRTGFLVAPREVDELRMKISALLSDRALAEQFGRAGRRRVEEKYNWESSVRQLDALYREVRAEKPS
jgi:glycosyltransferase involved in cell wall biosynthesis